MYSSSKVSLPKEIAILFSYQMGWQLVGLLFYWFHPSWGSAIFVNGFSILMGSRAYAVYRRRKNPPFFTKTNQFWLAFYGSGIYTALQGAIFFLFEHFEIKAISFKQGSFYLLAMIPILWLCTFLIAHFCLRFQLPSFPLKTLPTQSS